MNIVKLPMMKLVLTLTFLHLAHVGVCQNKKDAKVIVKVQDTAGLLNKVTLMLYEKGYSIAHKDEAIRVISTEEKSLGSASAKYRLIIKDSTIILSGDIASNVSLTFGSAKVERHFSPIYYGGMKGSDLRLAWNEMVAIAKLLGSEVAFSK